MPRKGKQWSQEQRERFQATLAKKRARKHRRSKKAAAAGINLPTKREDRHRQYYGNKRHVGGRDSVYVMIGGRFIEHQLRQVTILAPVSRRGGRQPSIRTETE